jgi:hypothetical protein
MDCKKLKELLLTECKNILLKKLEIIAQELKHLSQAIAEDTKSSAGDKYETSREMANLEKGKLQSQSSGFNKSLSVLNSLPLSASKKIGHGSLIQTEKAWIYIAVSLGQVFISEKEVLVISPAAPLAQLMSGRGKEDSINFRDNNYQIVSIC